MDISLTTDTVSNSYQSLEAELEPDTSEAELGQRNEANDIRTIITNRNLKGVGLSVVGEVRRVSYGTWVDRSACLLAMKFYFKLADHSIDFERLEISILFRKLASSEDKDSDIPVVRALAPRKLYGFSSARRRTRKWEIEALYWQDSGSSSGVKGQPRDPDDEHDTTITGSVWFPSRHHKPHQANWQVTNDAQSRRWPILDELDLVVVVEHGGPFEATVDITATRPNHLLARILSQPWWSKDHPLLFNRSTTKGPAPSTLAFNELRESDWAQLVTFSGADHIPKATEKTSYVTYRVRGIPLGFGKEGAQKAICKVCEVGTSKFIVTSFAKNPHREEMVATVSFTETPSILKGEGRDEWTLQYHPDYDFQNIRDLNLDESRDIIHLVFDIHFRGFTPLGSPESDSKHVVDIIAVSGLGGHAFGSFKERGGQFMWLRDALPYDLERARILIYGHDSRLPDSRSFQNLTAISGQLQSSLRSIRNLQSGTNPHVPLILIGHSLGGIIIKKVMVEMAKGDESDRANLQSIYGILFFGTPNQGMDISSLVAMVGDQPNRYFLESLGRGSEVLSAIMKSFDDVFTSMNYEIVSFYETAESPTAVKVNGHWEISGRPTVLVDMHSATQGTTLKKGKGFVEAINRNHSDMVKFRRNDEDYERAIGHLKRMVHQAVVTLPNRSRND